MTKEKMMVETLAGRLMGERVSQVAVLDADPVELRAELRVLVDCDEYWARFATVGVGNLPSVLEWVTNEIGGRSLAAEDRALLDLLAHRLGES